MTPIQFLGEWLVRSSLLILTGALLLWLLRVTTPAIRLAAWTAMLAGSLAMPLLHTALPKLPLTVMRPAVRPSATRAVSSGPVIDSPRPNVTESASSATPLQAVPAKPFPWMRLAAVAYALAAAALLLRLFAGLVLSLRMLRRSRPTGLTTDGNEVRESDRVVSPVTVGLLRPVVLLPADWREWDSAKLDAVLAHERSHIRRRDPAVQFVSGVHRALLWASPLSWFLDRSIVRTAEEISDDDAIAATRDRISYAEILLEFVQRGAGQRAVFGVSMARYDRPEKRIRRILNSTAVPRKVSRGGIAAILLLGAPLAYLAAAAHPQSATELHRTPSRLRPTLQSTLLEAAESVPSATPAPAATAALTAEPTSAPEPPVDPEPAPQSSPAQAIPAAAELPRFEVASITPDDPNSQGMRMVGVKVFPGGRVRISYFSLRGLIYTAFGISPASGVEDWMGKDLYLVEAKPTEAMQTRIKDLRFTNFTIEDPQIREMLQALLIDRFQLKFHRETKTGEVYLLERNAKPFAAHPTKTLPEPADPAGPAAVYNLWGSIGYAGGQWNISGTSMPQLAKFASDFVLHVPVFDRTELTGSFDYRQRQPDLEPKYGGDQSDSFKSYLAELGLKLERTTGPVETFVIDHAAKPSAN